MVITLWNRIGTVDDDLHILTNRRSNLKKPGSFSGALLFSTIKILKYKH